MLEWRAGAGCFWGGIEASPCGFSAVYSTGGDGASAFRVSLCPRSSSPIERARFPTSGTIPESDEIDGRITWVNSYTSNLFIPRTNLDAGAALFTYASVTFTSK